MKERPIIFAGVMVRAILAGMKTQTRRAVKPHRAGDGFVFGQAQPFVCPYGLVGDRMWVRETFCDDWCESRGIVYRADGGLDIDMLDAGCEWRPSIHMPRWASRLTLEITDVRVERLQDISEADARAEGVSFVADGCARFGVDGLPESWCDCPVTAYATLFDTVNSRDSWDANPWVFALSFRRLDETA